MCLCFFIIFSWTGYQSCFWKSNRFDGHFLWLHFKASFYLWNLPCYDFQFIKKALSENLEMDRVNTKVFFKFYTLALLQVSYWVVFPCKMPCPWQCNINILRAFLTLLCCWSGMELNFMFLLQFLCVPFTVSAVNSTTSRSIMLLDQASGIRCSNVLASPEQMEKLLFSVFALKFEGLFSSFSPVSIPFYHSGPLINKF